jgi:L-malate glycosyltransferase
MKVLFLNPYPFGIAAGQRLKYEQYLDYFSNNGIEVTNDYFMSKWLYRNRSSKIFSAIVILLTIYFSIRRWVTVLFKVRQFDCVYVFMWATPVGSPILEFILRYLSKRLVYDMEDAIDDGSSWIGKSAKSCYLLRVSDANIVSSSFLEKRIREINPNTYYISSSVDLKKWLPLKERPIALDGIVIGWTGTFSSGAYLKPLIPHLINFCQKNNHKLLIIGDFILNEYSDVDCIEFRQWTKKCEISDLQEIDIGIYPLPDKGWVYGKSGLKLIQYLALGIPQVSSNVGMNKILIDDGTEGFLVEAIDDWVNRLSTLCNDPTLRKQMGKRARITAEKNHGFSTIASKYLDVLERVNK